MQPATGTLCPHGRLVGCVLCNLSTPAETPETREEMLALARRALISLDARKDEDIDEWARRLIASVDGPIPSSVTPATGPVAETRRFTHEEISALRQAAYFLAEQRDGMLSTKWSEMANPWRELVPTLRSLADKLSAATDTPAETRERIKTLWGELEEIAIHAMPYESEASLQWIEAARAFWVDLDRALSVPVQGEP